MRKGRDGESGGEKKKKIKTFLVATNVIASRPPERRPTEAPTARAKNLKTSLKAYLNPLETYLGDSQ